MASNQDVLQIRVDVVLPVPADWHSNACHEGLRDLFLTRYKSEQPSLRDPLGRRRRRRRLAPLARAAAACRPLHPARRLPPPPSPPSSRDLLPRGRPPPASARPRRWPGRPTESAAGRGSLPCRRWAAAGLPPRLAFTAPVRRRSGARRRCRPGPAATAAASPRWRGRGRPLRRVNSAVRVRPGRGRGRPGRAGHCGGARPCRDVCYVPPQPQRPQASVGAPRPRSMGVHNSGSVQPHCSPALARTARA